MDRLEQAKLVLKYATDEIERLEAERAEAQRPELRRGDYGFAERQQHEDGTFVVADQSTLQGSPKAFYGDGAGQIDVNDCGRRHVRIGNIYDDLEKMAEDLDRFDMAGSGCTSPSEIHAQLEDRNGGIASICTGGPWCWLTLDELNELILNLRRLQATQERKNAKDNA